MVKVTGRHGNKRTSGNITDYCIINIGLNAEKSRGNFRKVVVTQNPERNSQLMLVGKISSVK